MKRCVKCGVVQPLANFYKATGTRDGLRGDCKACFKARAKARYPQVRDQAIARAKKWREDNIERFRETQRRNRSTDEAKRKSRAGHLKRKYGITLERYEELLTQQGGVCAICERAPRDDISLHVDHNPATGAIRGLLCFLCNNALGDFGDDARRLARALDYLALHEAPDEVALARARAHALKRVA